eukprot:COSAG02_NODE_3311_length_6956_cov_3.255359_4_plen_153_part_00
MARDWRNGDLDGCHTFMAHEAGFNGQDIQALTRGILANGTDLVSLDLAGSNLMETVDSPSGLEALVELLGSPVGLEQVNLESNNLGATAGTALGQAIGSKACPAKLRLGRNALGPVGGKGLADALASGDSGLRELSLEENGLGDEGRFSRCH